MTQDEIFKLFRNGPRLETERLILIPPSRKYVYDMFEYCRLNEVTEYVTWFPHEDISVTKKYVSGICRKAKQGKNTEWFIIHRATGKMIGTCGFVSLYAADKRGEIGYAMNPKFWGFGYMTEATKEVIRFGFEKIGLERIQAKHDLRNIRSGAVMERAGMTREGTLRKYLNIKGRQCDIAICSIIRKT